METIISKVRAEIERLKGIGGIVPLDNREQKTGYESALIDIETFLDTLEEEPVDVSRDENIGLSIMFFIGTHVKHENSVLVRGKGEVTYKEACEWIRRNIAREKSEKPMNQDELEKEIGSYMSNKWKFGCVIPITPVVLPNFTTEDLKDFARHFYELGQQSGSSEKPNNHLEQIVCPKCGAIQTAKVEHTAPFYSYVHECEKCGYTILESEWNNF